MQAEVGEVSQRKQEIGEYEIAGKSGASSFRRKKISVDYFNEGSSHITDPQAKLSKANNTVRYCDKPKWHRFVKLYFCQICQYKNQSKSDVQTHMNIHAGEEQVVCEFCQLRCNHPSELKIHVINHMGDRPYACDICDASFLIIRDLVNHEATHDLENKPYSCDTCNYRCRHASFLEEHEKFSHSRYACTACGFRCTKASTLATHKLTHTGEEPYHVNLSDDVTLQSEDVMSEVSKVSWNCKDEIAGTSGESRRRHKKLKLEDLDKTTDNATFDTLENNAKNTVRAPNQPHVCSKRPHECRFVKLHFCLLCQYNNQSKSDVEGHMNIHLGENQVVCDFCKRRCKQPDGLKNHIIKHISHRPYACDICDEGFYLLHDLMKHETTHNVEKPYSCETCQYKCRWPSLLEEHNKIHSKPGTHSCGMCGFRCFKASALARHKLTHTGAKPYLCGECDFSCFKPSQLKVHAAVHSGEKPYLCQVCDFRSARKGSLKLHMRIHTGETYACNICAREFTRPWIRNAHELKAHSSQPQQPNLTIEKYF